jgi:hypothetical protein
MFWSLLVVSLEDGRVMPKHVETLNLNKVEVEVTCVSSWLCLLRNCFHLVFNPQHLPAAIADRRIGKNAILRNAGRPATIRKTSSFTCNKHRKLNKNDTLYLSYTTALTFFVAALNGSTATLHNKS